MLKINVVELEQALKLIRRTSNDLHITIAEEPTHLRLTYGSADNEICTINLYHDATNVTAKFNASTSLASEVARRKL